MSTPVAGSLAVTPLYTVQATDAVVSWDDAAATWRNVAPWLTAPPSGGPYLPLTGGTLTGPLAVGGNGVTYSTFTSGGADGNTHAFRFGWTGGNLVMSIDGATGIQLANTTQLGNYLLLTGGTLSGNLGFSPSTNGITGTNANNNATAGNVGEYVSAINGGGQALAVQTGLAATNITSISLTAGDWDVEGMVQLRVSSGTATIGVGGITATSATVPGLSDAATYGYAYAIPAGSDQVIQLISARLSLAATTTVYLIGQLQGQAGTGFGRIRARRMR